VARAWRECGLKRAECVLFALGKQGARRIKSQQQTLMSWIARKDAISSRRRVCRKFQKLLEFTGLKDFALHWISMRPGGKWAVDTTPHSSRLLLVRVKLGNGWRWCVCAHLRDLKILQRADSDLAPRFPSRKFLDYTLLED